MTTPNYSFVLSAQLVGSTTASVGNVMIPSDSVAGRWVVATSANRGTRTSEAIALTAYGGSGAGSIQLQQAGVIDASISGLGTAGSLQLVRCSTTGTIERVSGYTPGDDIIGYAKPDGRVHLHFGLPWGLFSTASGTPAGSDKQIQYNNVGVFGGAANATISGGNLKLGSWAQESLGVLSVGVDTSFDKGYLGVYVATAGTETYATANLPDGGLIRCSYYLSDGSFHGNSVSIISYLASTENNPVGSPISCAAMGISGGSPFFGDPSYIAQSNVYGDGILIDAGPGGGGAGSNPLTSFTGEIRLKGKLVRVQDTYLVVDGDTGPNMADYGHIRGDSGGVDGNGWSIGVRNGGNTDNILPLAVFNLTGIGDVVTIGGGADFGYSESNAPQYLHMSTRGDFMVAFATQDPQSHRVGLAMVEYNVAGPIVGWDHRRAVVLHRHINLVVFGSRTSLATPDDALGGGEGVVAIGNAEVVPTANSNNGGILYAQGGALKWRGSAGTVTTLAVA